MRVFGMSQWMLGAARRLARDERGAVLVYVSIALTVFMGFAALVIDGGRVFTLNTEMQSAADALALAGAAELDGNSDAETRATAAMNDLLQNDQRFAAGDRALTAYTPRFLSALPADDQPLSAATLSTDPTETRFVEVTMGERDVDSMFATAIGGDQTAGTDAVAIAGFTSAVCKFTPLFMCNPYEGTGENFLDKIGEPAERRKIVALKKSGAGASYAPGNFGFLQSIDDDTKFKESLGKADPGACFEKDGVDTKTGSVDSARQALNTRFDMWDGSFNGKKNDAAYRPARNVTKGYLPKSKGNGGACNVDLDTGTPPKAMGFPIDSVVNANRLGNGDWNGQFDAYWNLNHPGVSKPNGWSSLNLPSRYDVYRWEIDTNHIPNNSGSGGENGNPQCSSSTVSDNPDRRILYAAVLNCEELGLAGHETGLPVVAFIKMFMTQPMTKLPGTGQIDEDDTLYVEMIDVVKPGTDDAVVHDIVQLYR
jgi:Flp pilus assembly protein TadG